jgi:hypothetical protein
MQKLLQVCCAAVALTALAACGDSVLTSPVSRSPGAVSRDVSGSLTPVCSAAGVPVQQHAGLGAGSFGSFNPAIAPVPNIAWHAPLTGSVWIIPNDLGGATPPSFSAANAPDNVTSHYQVTFSVPAHVTATLTGQSWADNQVTQILLDNAGGSIGSNADLNQALNYGFNGAGAPLDYTHDISALSVGSHTLDFYVANNAITQPTNPTGIDFCFHVDFTNPPPPPAPALFVIGNDQPHAINDIVNFWGAQWWKNNPTSITSDNGWESFKGFAPITGTCGQQWSSGPGNSDPPPAAPLPSSINIIVTDKVNKNGNTLSGNIIQIITVTQDGHYQANPGHAGNGVVTAVVCPAG